VSDTYAACVTAPEVELGRVWRRLVGVDAGRAGDAALDELLARHRQPHRRYHTATHVMWVLRHIDDLAAANTPVDLDAVRAAALFHDAVYDPRSPTNEHDSAVLARRVLADCGWESARVERVAALIELTAGHVAPRADDWADDGADTGADTGADILLDADLAILGAEPADYRAYVTGVRAEYAHVDDDAWRVGRAAVLRSFLDRPAIYRTTSMQAARERRARANLSAELADLQRTEPQ
jgi:predicted metal-dependent HD superfamily phosphohydrolase